MRLKQNLPGFFLLLALFVTPVPGTVQPDSTVVSAEIENVHEEKSSLYCSCNNIDGRVLVFDVTVHNKTKDPQTVFLFVWAANDTVSPIERGLWPLSAVESALTEEGELQVSSPADGRQVDIPPGQSVRVKEGFILQPIGWWNGELVGLERLRIEIWSAEGEKLFSKEQVVKLGARNQETEPEFRRQE